MAHCGCEGIGLAHAMLTDPDRGHAIDDDEIRIGGAVLDDMKANLISVR